MNKILAVIVICLLFFFSIASYAQNVSNYLILQDIGSYRFITQVKNPSTKEVIQTPGYSILKNAGILSSTGHFRLDHKDIAYETDCESDVTDLGVEVQVTQHAGVDSDKWLLHELDMEFRNYYGIPDLTYTVRAINGNTILVDATGGRDYRWLSGNKVIKIEYTALKNLSTIPEPLEIVQAYLSKHPSSIIPFTLQELRVSSSVSKWIKDEMERRLWLCDKWLMQLQLGKATQADTLEELVKHMTVFLNYRQKYYGVAATEDIAALNTALRTSDGTTIKNKLASYKTWWSANKGKSISLP